MIISSSQVQNVIKLYGKHIHRTGLTPKPDVTAPFAKTDQVSISADSRIKQKAIQAAKAAPDIR
ncbi:MAG: hypothetical protein NUV35_02195, partial [Syntrophomonadaceae bacterium]|nr:hypothetical protein [Syntrophomonadaceae bacterium]